jgi:hypothetical protein
MSREKMCIPSKTLPGKGLSQETQMQGKKKVVKQQANKKTQDNREKIKEKNTPNPKKRRLSPIWSPITLRGKYIYGKG